MLGSAIVEHQPAPGGPLDLRRGVRRDLAEVLMSRATLLSELDRYLVQGVFRDGRPLTELAALWEGDGPGPRPTPKALRRRLRRLVERVLSPRFEFVAAHRHRWPPTRRRVATACVLHGLSCREAADKLRLSIHLVRRHMDAVETVYGAMASGGGR